MEPKDVIYPFKSKTAFEVIYNLNGFSVSWGRERTSSGEERDCLAMRWNEINDEGRGEEGFPLTVDGKRPSWFTVSPELSLLLLPIIRSLVASADKK